VCAVVHSTDNIVAAGSSIASDRSLLRRFRMGQEEAATQLYHRYAPRLQSLARRECSGSLASRVDADDIVQSVFCAFFQGARKGYYDLPDGEDLWRLILVIALNKVREKRVFHRAAKRDVRLTAPADCLQLQAENPPGKLLRIAFDDAMEQLDGSQRKMAELLLEGYEVAEIAVKVGRSKRTVERNLQEIRNKLRRLLQRDASSA
jgi:RNA polymerase sigma-70 factor (ECF subfamily)